jgi:hypothetical protein
MSESPQHGSLILAPFGRILLAYQQDNVCLKHPITIFVGKDGKERAFEECRQGFLSSFLPFGEDFKRLKWPIKDQKIVVQDTGNTEEIELMRFGVHLLSYQPRVIFIYSDKYPSQLLLPTGSQYHG